MAQVAIKENAIHANLNHRPRRHSPDGIDTSQNKGFRPIRIVDVTGPVQKIDDLAGMGQGAE